MAHEAKQIRTVDGQKTLAPARTTSMALPEVVEAVDGFGHISFRVRNKPFVIMGEDADGPWLSVKADPHTQAFLLKQGDFTKTPYIGQHGWVTAARIPPSDWSRIVELVEDAYELVAPKRLAAQVREARSGASGDS